MKSAKVSASEGASSASRRAQPVRQTRVNPPRTSSLNRANSLPGGSAHEQPIEIFPAVTHFTDAITALPKELVRHFTLLKEVDAKICAPKEDLFRLIESIFDSPAPEPAVSLFDGSTAAVAGKLQPNVRNVGNGAASSAGLSTTSSVGDHSHAVVFDPSNVPRRQHFRQTAFKIQEMLVALEEKNHVISTANDALEKQLARIEDVWPHLQGEFSGEAKWGSMTHWAYLENRVAKTNNTQAERSRREGAATLSAAAQQLAEEAAARSSDRKKAIAEKKGAKGHAAEADTDSKPHEPAKKSQNSNKSRKGPSDAAAPVGLGITANGPVNGNSSSKRRKVENKTNGSAPMERALSSVLGANAPKTKTASPRETPALEASSKKRKALPTASNPSKKSRTGAAASPSVASSPIISSFPEGTKPGRASPAPPSAPRPVPTRARQNSVHSAVEIVRPKPVPAAPSKPNGVPAATTNPKPQIPETQTTSEVKTTKESTPVTKPDAAEPEVENWPSHMEPPAATKKETTSKVAEERESKKESATSIVAPATTATATTKSGRASKPSTPALATFSEAANAKSRPSRGSEGATTATKRSHKKGGSISAAAAAVALAAQQAAAEEDAHVRPSAEEDDEAENDGDEPRYCYCNGVSYGEMVACDGLGCPREWFHLECVGLRVAPKGNAKWYCDDCRKRLKIPEKRVNGR